MQYITSVRLLQRPCITGKPTESRDFQTKHIISDVCTENTSLTCTSIQSAGIYGRKDTG